MIRTLLLLLFRPPLDLCELHDTLPIAWHTWLLDKLGLTAGYRWLMFEVLEELDDALSETAA